MSLFLLFCLGFKMNDDREFVYSNYSGERIYQVYTSSGVDKGWYWSLNKNSPKIKMGIERAIANDDCFRFILRGKSYYYRITGVAEHKSLATKYLTGFEQVNSEVCIGQAVDVFNIIQIPY